MTNQYQLIKSEKFNDIQTDFYTSQNDEMYMTAEQLGICLGYSNPRIAISKLFNRHEYIKNDEFSVVTKLVTTDGKSYETRLFTEDGIYEITFLSKTAIAQVFRAWARKVIKEIRKTGSYSVTTLQGNSYNILLGNLNENQKILICEQKKINDKLDQHIQVYGEDKEMLNDITLSIGYEIDGIKKDVQQEITERTSYIPVRPIVAKRANVIGKARLKTIEHFTGTIKDQKLIDEYTGRINSITANMLNERWTISKIKEEAEIKSSCFSGDNAFLHDICVYAYEFYKGMKISQ
jgi:prophage antirepressor-like protein